MSRLFIYLLAILCTNILLVDGSAQAQYWERRLYDGGRVQVDPDTNRITVYPDDGPPTQLWDGVHRLEDGTSITVHSGVMVPNTELIELRRTRETVRGRPFVDAGDSPCLRLVRKVCGLHDECGDSPPCAHARQLQLYEAEEQEERPEQLRIPAQCRDALEDEAFFTPCGRPQSAAKPTACEQLVWKVCGLSDECAERRGCGPARQLLQLELEERRASANPDAATQSTAECGRALLDGDFFARCKP
jgi:hypothetical protein